MKQVHYAHERGESHNSWLTSHHSFNFAHYFHPQRKGHGQLIVLNDDSVLPKHGFGMHGHKNMEIISIPLSGSLLHKDSMGNEHLIETGDVQIMSAGSGIKHSEFNPSADVAVNFLQIWIVPNKIDVTPRYEQRTYDASKLHNNFLPIVSPLSSATDAVSIYQDAVISLSEIEAGVQLDYVSQYKNSACFFFILNGEVHIDQENLQARDSLALTQVEVVNIKAVSSCKLLCIETL